MPEKVKVNADFYMNDLLPKLIEDVKTCCQTTSYSSKMAHRPIRLASLKNGSSSIVRSSSRRMSGHQIHLTSILSTTTSVGAVLEMYKVFTPKPTNKAELETVLEAIWEDLPQESIDPAELTFRKRLQACIRADGGHFEHLLK